MKRFFFSRLLRERLLLVVLLVGGGAVVLTSTLRALGEFWQLDARLNRELQLQRTVLAQRPVIEERARAAAARFNPSSTFDALRLASEVEAMTRTAGIKNSSTSDARTSEVSQFALHSLQLSVRNSDYASLVRLYQEISRRSPYLSIDQLSIVANPGSPAQLNAAWQISSVEVASR